MRLAHILITRFSYRGKDAFKDTEGPTFESTEDPLDPARLDLRFKLFELACLPSVLGQTEQRFIWVLLVDRELPEKYAARLRSLICTREDTFIRAFDPQCDLGALDWLRSYLPHGIDRVMTTNLDDDDSLPAQFVAATHARVRALEGAATCPAISIIGARQIVEWDLVGSADAPLGWKAPWHRKTRVASVGLSLLCQGPEFNFCVLGLRHALAEAYVDFSGSQAHPNVLAFRQAVIAAAHRAGADVRVWKPEDLFYDISRDVGPVLMTNHPGNDQARRLREPKAERTIVAGPGDFPGVPIDWEKARSFVET